MQDLNDLYYYVQVVEHGGFAPAARVIGIQKSKLSRRIQALEERLGVRLLNRTSRHFSVTDIGRDYYERCRAVLVEAEAAERIVAEVKAEPAGIIRIACPVSLLNFQFGELFARFMGQYPQVEVHLESTNRRVDVLEEGFDLAIRVRFPPLEASDLVMRQLDVSTQCLVASPDLIAGPLQSPADLQGVPSLSMGGAYDKHEWRLEHVDGQLAITPYRPRLLTDNMAVLRETALAGQGVVQLPTMMIWKDIQAGTLIHVLPDWRPKAGIVHAVFPSRRGLLPAVRALLDFLVTACAEQRNAVQMH